MVMRRIRIAKEMQSSGDAHRKLTFRCHRKTHWGMDIWAWTQDHDACVQSYGDCCHSGLCHTIRLGASLKIS